MKRPIVGSTTPIGGNLKFELWQPETKQTRPRLMRCRLSQSIVLPYLLTRIVEDRS